MKLYDSGRAPNPRRVKIFLAEKGIAIETTQIDILALEQRSPDVSARNPSQRVPFLELDDGRVISESIAICRYFEEIQPDPPLFGLGAFGRAEVEMWQRRLELDLLMPVAFAFRHLHPSMAAMEVPQLPEWGEINKGRAEPILRILDRHLADRPFVCGDTFTVADITGLVGLDFMKPARMSVSDSFPHVRRWHRDLAARPSARA